MSIVVSRWSLVKQEKSPQRAIFLFFQFTMYNSHLFRLPFRHHPILFRSRFYLSFCCFLIPFILSVLQSPSREHLVIISWLSRNHLVIIPYASPIHFLSHRRPSVLSGLPSASRHGVRLFFLLLLFFLWFDWWTIESCTIRHRGLINLAGASLYLESCRVSSAN